MTQHEKDVETLLAARRLINAMDASFILQEHRYSPRLAALTRQNIIDVRDALSDEGLNARQPYAVNHQLTNLLAIANRANALEENYLRKILPA